jgi:ribosomal protein S8
MAVEECEVIGELSQDYIDQFEALNKENNLTQQTIQLEMDTLHQINQDRMAAIQARGREIWDKIGKEFGIDVVKEVLKVEKDGTTGITKLFKVSKK